MKGQTCCFTGHRKMPKEGYAAIRKRIESEIINPIHRGVRYFGAGGALGFDVMAAEIFIKLKKAFPHIRLTLVPPCKEQARVWDEEDIKKYNLILNKADKVIYTSEHYYKGCMHKRNRHLADNSRYCACFLREPGGGTAYTVRYAAEKGLGIINPG